MAAGLRHFEIMGKLDHIKIMKLRILDEMPIVDIARRLGKHPVTIGDIIKSYTEMEQLLMAAQD